MRTLGLLGGMAWPSTAEAYRLLNEQIAQRLGGSHSARLLVWSTDFADIETLQAAGRWDTAGQILADAAQRLEAAGAEGLLLCTNTMHRVADAISAAVDIPLLHIADATAQRIQADGHVRVGLLGTRFTMEEAFYRDRLSDHGLQVLTPDADDRAEIHQVIYDGARNRPGHRHQPQQVHRDRRSARHRRCSGGHRRLHGDRAPAATYRLGRSAVRHDPSSCAGRSGLDARGFPEPMSGQHDRKGPLTPSRHGPRRPPVGLIERTEPSRQKRGRTPVAELHRRDFDRSLVGDQTRITAASTAPRSRRTNAARRQSATAVLRGQGPAPDPDRKPLSVALL